MNIELNLQLYIVALISALFLITFILIAILYLCQLYSRIKVLQGFVSQRDKVIRDLQNRLMSKNFDQYKMYDQPVKEYIPEQIEEEFNESAVGKISGEELIPDA